MNKDEITVLLEHQAELAFSLDKVEKNLNALKSSERTENSYGRYWHQSKALWENFVGNHHNLARPGVEIPAAYLTRVSGVIRCFRAIKQFIGATFPVMVNNQKDEQEELNTLPPSDPKRESQANDSAAGGETQQQNAQPSISQPHQQLPYVAKPQQLQPSTSGENQANFTSLGMASQQYGFGYAQPPIPSPQIKPTSAPESASYNTSYAANNQVYQQQVPISSDGGTSNELLVSILSQLTQSIMLTNQAALQQAGGPTLGKLKIPRLDVEEFTGDILEYQNFKKTFQVMVDRAKIDPIDQFLLLQSKVKGPAANELPRQISDKSLQEAWTNLDNRYNNQRRVVEATIMHFMDACDQGPTTTASILRQLQAHQEAVFNLSKLQLSAMDVLRCLAIAKMDELMSQRFNDFLDEATKFPTEKDYRTFLEKEHAIYVTADNLLENDQTTW